MHRLALLTIAASSLFYAGAVQSAEKCYEDVYVPASFECATTNSKSADFTNGCKPVSAHYEKKEIECPTARWVNVIADTRVRLDGTPVTHSQMCAKYGMKPAVSEGKICASGERPARQGNGWESIIYKYGTKGGGNGNVGGDKFEDVQYQYGGYSGGDNGYDQPIQNYRGTMCYNYSMGRKNHTPEDAVIAVFCE